MSRPWSRWTVVGEEVALAKYVLPEVVQRYAGSPGPSGGAPADRLAAVYAALRANGIRYAPAAESDERGRQVIRTPAEIFTGPRLATCLDLALTLGAASLAAGLAPMIFIVGGGVAEESHALVGFWLGGDESRPEPGPRGWWETPFPELAAIVQPGLDGPPGLLVVDPTGLAGPLQGARTPGAGLDLAEAVRQGADQLLGRPWRLGLDLAAHWRAADQFDAGLAPGEDPLRSPYAEPPPDESVLSLFRAEYAKVPFQPCDEFVVLRDLCDKVAAEGGSALVVVHGAGGAGKTRLALELAKSLTEAGWYAGALRPRLGPDDRGWTNDIGWLGRVATPTLAIVDYADAHTAEARAVLDAVRRRDRVVVLLIARSAEGWLQRVRDDLQANRYRPAQRIIPLPDHHPDEVALFRQAYRALGGDPAATPSTAALARPVSGRWTTLDYVLLGWFAALSGGRLPGTPDELYDEVLVHERRYWRRVWERIDRAHEAPESLISIGAALITLATPEPDEVDAVLAALPGAGPDRRHDVGRTLLTCLRPRPGERLAIRPDPVGDHLLMAQLNEDRSLLSRVLEPGTSRALRCLATVNRAGFRRPELATEILIALVRERPDWWEPIYWVAFFQGGPALAAIEELVGEQEPILPLDAVAGQVPPGHAYLWRLGLLVDRQRLSLAQADPDTDASALADLWDHIAEREFSAGNLAAAMGAARESVALYRALAADGSDDTLQRLAQALGWLSMTEVESGDGGAARASASEVVEILHGLRETDSDQYRAALANALDVLAVACNLTGDSDEALRAAVEGLEIIRRLSESYPETYRSNLARALGNLSLIRKESGDLAGALRVGEEAVAVSRPLAEATPEAYLPGLANALTNLSNAQLRTGDSAGSVRSAAEADSFYLLLTRLNPKAHLLRLAASRSNLANRYRSIGRPDLALIAAGQAVDICRDLARENLDSPRPALALALALNNLSAAQHYGGQPDQALASATEAVQLARELAGSSLEAHGKFLAECLTSLSVAQVKVGQGAAALEAEREAVALLRRLAATRRRAVLPSLAMTLNNLGNSLNQLGDLAGALRAATEAVELWRSVEELNDDARSGLAMALDGLSVQYTENHRPREALAASEEAVAIYRSLNEANPETYRSELANTLANLANRQNRADDPTGAMASATEAVAIRRRLADTDPDANLPDLANNLTVLGNRYYNEGDPHTARLHLSEAVRMFRTLAEAQPVVFRPRLAIALNNLAGVEATLQEVAAARDTFLQAVELYRSLVAANPAAFLPYLATTLANLSGVLSSTGDGVAARIAATEAADIHRRLAGTDPSIFAPHFAASLLTLAQQERDEDRVAALAHATEAVAVYRGLGATHHGELAEALADVAALRGETDRQAALADATEAVAISRVLTGLPPDQYVEGLAFRVRALANLTADGGELDAAVALLQAEVDRAPDPFTRAAMAAYQAGWFYLRQMPEPGMAALRYAIREAHESGNGWVRRLVRGTVRDLELTDPDLPVWTTAEMPQPHLTLLNDWLLHDDWAARSAYLRSHAAELMTPGVEQTLLMLQYLRPDRDTATRQLEMIAMFHRYGVEQTLSRLDSAHAERSLVEQWLGISNLEESAAFLNAHREELLTEETLSNLADRDEPEAELLSAVVLLVGGAEDPATAVEPVYECVRDVAKARQEALTAIEHGDLMRLGLLTAANRALRRTALVEAVIQLAEDDEEAAVAALAPLLAEEAATAREAAIIRLRSLARSEPTMMASATRLADRLTGH